MKLTWKPRPGVTGTPVVLGDNTRNARGPGAKVITSFTPGFQYSVQAAAYPEADAIETFGRENLATEVSVIVAYEFSSYGECTKFLAGLGASLASEGVLEVAHTGGGADSMEACIQSARALQQVGASAFVQYQFLGGAFTRGQGNNL